MTRPTTWEGTGEVRGSTVRLQALIAFPFAAFALPPPRVMRVLSTEDSIRLEAAPPAPGVLAPPPRIPGPRSADAPNDLACLRRTRRSLKAFDEALASRQTAEELKGRMREPFPDVKDLEITLHLAAEAFGRKGCHADQLRGTVAGSMLGVIYCEPRLDSTAAEGPAQGARGPLEHSMTRG